MACSAPIRGLCWQSLKASKFYSYCICALLSILSTVGASLIKYNKSRKKRNGKKGRHGLQAPFRMVCGYFIIPECCKPCLFLSIFQFAQLIIPYPCSAERADAQPGETRLLARDKPSRFSYVILISSPQWPGLPRANQRITKRKILFHIPVSPRCEPSAAGRSQKRRNSLSG